MRSRNGKYVSTLRLWLAVVLSLHLGFTYAAERMPVADAAASVHTTAADDPSDQGHSAAELPCHSAEGAASGAQGKSPHAPSRHPCCELGQCHCVAILPPSTSKPSLFVTAAIARVAYFRSAHTHVTAPDLRPPIS